MLKHAITLLLKDFFGKVLFVFEDMNWKNFLKTGQKQDLLPVYTGFAIVKHCLSSVSVGMVWTEPACSCWLCSSLCLLSLPLSLGTTKKSRPLDSKSFGYLKDPPLSLLHPEQSQVSLSLSAYGRYSRPFIIFVALHWTLCSSFQSFLNWAAQNWTQYSKCSLTRAE